MKFSTALLAASFAAGLGLFAIVVFRQPASTPADIVGPEAPDTAQNPQDGTGADGLAASKSQTEDAASTEALLAKGEAFWAALHDPDPAKFEKNLRQAGLPDHIVSAVIAAEANERARLRSVEARKTPSGPQDERVASGSATTRKTIPPSIAVNAGPLSYNLDFIDPSRRAQAQAITRDYDALIHKIRGAGRLLTDAEKQTLAQLEGDRHEELKAILTPRELADYEMLKSPLYHRLAYETSGFKPTLEEFRAIYEAVRAAPDHLGFSDLTGMPSSPKDREAALQARAKMDDQLLLKLGTERFAEYDRSRNYEYRELQKLVRRVNLPDSQAVQVFSMRDYVAAESNRIYGDAALTAPEKLSALQSLAGSVRQQIRYELGNEAGSAYLKVADRWLTQVEQGRAVTFGTNSESYKSVSGAPKPPRPSTPPAGG